MANNQNGALYEFVLLVTELQPAEDTVWTFGPPPTSDLLRLRPMWGEIHRIVFNPPSEPVPVDHLFAQLQEGPYGVLPGVMSILLAAFLLAYPDETRLYREGRIVHEEGLRSGFPPRGASLHCHELHRF